MNKQLRQYLSLWLALWLALAPLPGLSLSLTVEAPTPCMMMHQQAADANDMSSEPTSSPCQHCQGDPCATDGCPAQDCACGAVGSLMESPVLSMALLALTQTVSGTHQPGWLSQSYPPPLHPPARSILQ